MGMDLVTSREINAGTLLNDQVNQVLNLVYSDIVHWMETLSICP